MSRMYNPLLFIGLAAVVVHLSACSPAPEEAAAPEAAPAETVAADAPELAPIREGSEPKDAAAPFGGADTSLAAKNEADGAGEVDHSISDAAPYGDDTMLEGLVPTGWKQAGPIEHYNVATLYNKINGRSELYMAYDVLGLSWVSFVKEGSQDDFLDLFVYDMRTPTNAFGIFSVEREPDQEDAGLGRMSYRTGSNFYFWKGKYYGYMNASRENETNTTVARGILTALMQRLEDSGEEVVGMDLLPKDGLIEDTVQYFKVDAMSLDFLTDTWSGEYNVGDGRARAFISQRPSAEDAAGILESFRGYGESYADSTESAKIEGLDVVVSDWGGDFFDAAFVVGDKFAGVSNVQGRETMNAAAAKLIKLLEKK